MICNKIICQLWQIKQAFQLHTVVRDFRVEMPQAKPMHRDASPERDGSPEK